MMVELEHTLIMLLLLVGLLNAQPNIHRFFWWVIVALITLSLFSPSIPFDLPWEVLSALIIPVILWQVVIKLVNSEMTLDVKDFLIWAGMAIVPGAVFFIFSDFNIASSFVFGLMAASMVWCLSAEKTEPALLGQVGPLTLAFLLTEIAPAVEAPGRYFVALLAGICVGALFGIITFQVIKKIEMDLKWRNLLGIGQVYVSYLVAISFGMSGIAAATSAIAFFVVLSVKRGSCPTETIKFNPLDTVPVYLFAVVIMAFSAWQNHTALTISLLIEVILSFIAVAIFIWVGKRVKSKPFLSQRPYFYILSRVAFLFVPTVLLWPREASINAVPLIIALALSSTAIILISNSITPVLNFYTWLEQTGEDEIKPDAVLNTLTARDLMHREHPVVSPDLPVTELVDLIAKDGWKCLPVVDSEKRLLGIVTEYDIFMQEKKLPGSAVVYQAIFNEPVKPEQLPDVFAERASKFITRDVMTSRVVSVKENDSIGHVVQLMIWHGFKCIPVTSKTSENKEEFLGLITRSGILHHLLHT